MNAISKAGTSGIAWRISLPSISRVNLLVISLLIFSVISAFAVIYCRDLSRQMTSDMQSLQYQTAKLTLQHNQLLVEQSSLSTDQRVAMIANNQLNMQAPAAKNVVMVRT